MGRSLTAGLMADIEEFHREEGDDEEMKADPVADGGGAGHPVWMLQGGMGAMHSGGGRN
jgi:hypothetical protein